MWRHAFGNLILLAFGVAPGTALTEYVSENAVPVVESVPPCYILGDSDLYGFGVRLSFYIQFGVGLIGVLFGLVDETKGTRFGFNVLYLALLIILIRNTVEGSFALLEWYIVTGLLFLLPATLLLVNSTSIDWFLSDDDEDETENQGKNKQTESSEPEASKSNGGPSSSAADEAEKSPDPSEQSDSDEARMEESIKTLANERNRMFLTDAIGLGFLYLLYAIFFFTQPWLYFTKAHSGHKEGCPVPIFFFGTFDLYNVHWQRFLKAGAAISCVSGFAFGFLGLFNVVLGVGLWKDREVALEHLNNRKDQSLRLYKMLTEEAEREAIKQQRAHDGAKLLAPKHQDQEDHENTLLERARNIQTTLEQTEAISTTRKANEIITKAEAWATKHKKQNKRFWLIRGWLCITIATSGGASIAFLEKTLLLNHIEVDDSISTSTGQLLALLVAILTTSGFLYEVYKAEIKRLERNQEDKAALARVHAAAATLRRTAEQHQLFRNEEARRAEARRRRQNHQRQELASASGSERPRAWPTALPSAWLRSIRGRGDPHVNAHPSGASV